MIETHYNFSPKLSCLLSVQTAVDYLLLLQYHNQLERIGQTRISIFFITNMYIKQHLCTYLYIYIGLFILNSVPYEASCISAK